MKLIHCTAGAPHQDQCTLPQTAKILLLVFEHAGITDHWCSTIRAFEQELDSTHSFEQESLMLVTVFTVIGKHESDFGVFSYRAI
jgi:hypothetical protein